MRGVLMGVVGVVLRVAYCMSTKGNKPTGKKRAGGKGTGGEIWSGGVGVGFGFIE